MVNLQIHVEFYRLKIKLVKQITISRIICNMLFLASWVIEFYMNTCINKAWIKLQSVCSLADKCEWPTVIMDETIAI